jgi:hypothetical protein
MGGQILMNHFGINYSRKWIMLACIILLSSHVFAQSAPVDTTQDSASVVDEDSSFTETEKVRDTVIFRAVPDSTVWRLQHLKEFEYANDPTYWKKKKQDISTEEGDSASANFLRVLQYLLLGIFIVVVLYALLNVLIKNKMVLFKSAKKWNNDPGDEEYPELPDLPGLIATAEAQQHFRLAARYRYVLLLHQLNERQLINMHSELTNWDYVKQLANHPLSAKFRYLTTAYDYVWYGEFDLSSQQYEGLRKRFETFLN